MLMRSKKARPKFDERKGIRILSFKGMPWYLIEQGPFEQGRDRPIVWAREEGKTYLVCPICRAINEIDTCGMFINVRDLDSNLCVVCSSCASHFWCSLIGWLDKETRRFMRRNHETCPFCEKSATLFRNERICRFPHRAPRLMDIYFCCGFFWPKSSSASAPIEEAKSR
jgi:hypothetical protein